MTNYLQKLEHYVMLLMYKVYMAMSTKRGKRVFFVSSVFVAGTSSVDWVHGSFKTIVQRLTDLNNALDLADDVDSLVGPAMLHEILWGTSEATELCQRGVLIAKEDSESMELMDICQRLAELSPLNLRYCRMTEMANDLREQFIKFGSADVAIA